MVRKELQLKHKDVHLYGFFGIFQTFEVILKFIKEKLEMIDFKDDCTGELV